MITWDRNRINVQVFLDCCRFTKLCCSRSIQIEAYHPNSSLVQQFTLLFLSFRQRSRDVVQIQIGGNPSKKGQKRSFTKTVSQRDMNNWPNCKTSVQPASVFLPSPRRNGINTHKYIRLAQLDWFPSINQGVSSRMFGKMHRYRIYFWFFWIKSRGYSTNCETHQQHSTQSTNHSYSPTVNKNGHRAKVVAGVWSTGSRRAIKGYENVVRFGYHEGCH